MKMIIGLVVSARLLISV